MRWVVYLVVVLVAVVVLVVIVGYSLPVRHSATRTARISLPPEVLYARLVDVDGYRAWRPEVTALSRQPDRDGRPSWTETTGNGTIPFYFERMEQPSLLMTRIADRSLPFGGTWTYRIAAAGTGSELTITEDGEVYNPIFRFMSRFVFGHFQTLDTFIRNLEAASR